MSVINGFRYVTELSQSSEVAGIAEHPSSPASNRQPPIRPCMTYGRATRNAVLAAMIGLPRAIRRHVPVRAGSNAATTSSPGAGQHRFGLHDQPGGRAHEPGTG